MINYPLLTSDLANHTYSVIQIFDKTIFIEKWLRILLHTGVVLFSIYFIRELVQNFKNLTTNLIFIIANLILGVVIAILIARINTFFEVPFEIRHSIKGETTKNFINIRAWKNTYYILWAIEITLFLLLIYTGIKTNFILKNKRH